MTNLAYEDPECDFKTFALHYYKIGFNVTCITNMKIGNDGCVGGLKEPSHEWKHLAGVRQDLKTLERYDWDMAVGLGAVLGYNDYRAIDIDGCNDLGFVRTALEVLGLPGNYEWVVKSGSHNGYHIFVRAPFHDFRIEGEKTKAFRPNGEYANTFKRLELRWQFHIVLPPSLHSTMHRYEFVNVTLPARPPSPIRLSNLYRLIEQVAVRKSGQASGSDEYLDWDIPFDGGVIVQVDASDEFLDYDTMFDELVEPAYGDFTPNPSDELSPDDPRDDDNEQVESAFERPYYLFFDTETTGLPKNRRAYTGDVEDWPRLVQLAWLQVDAHGNEIDVGTSIVRPDGYTIPAEASKVNHITTEKALREGLPLQSVLLTFEQIVEESDYLVAHNMKFDEKILEAEFIRMNIPTVMDRKPKLCTMQESTELCALAGPYGFKYPTLSELHSRLFGEGPSQAHSALSDVRTTHKCFWELRRRGIL